MIMQSVFRQQFSNASEIAAGSYFFVEPSESNRAKYAPFNRVSLINRSNLELEIRADGRNDDESKLTIRPKETVSDHLMNFCWLLVYNNDGSESVDANDMLITVERVV